MTIQDTIASMSKRMPWNVGSLTLYSLGLPRGRGWEKTLEAYDNPSKRVMQSQHAVEEALVEHLLVGEKMVRIYNCGTNDLVVLRRKLATLTPPNSPAGNVFPELLEDNALSEADDQPCLIFVHVMPGGVAALYSSVRTKPERQELSLDLLDRLEGSTEPDVESVYAVVSVPYQAFDVVYVPHNGSCIEVRMDFPDGTPQELISQSILKVESAFSADVELNIFADSLNLFPLIDSMYQDESEGVVVELHFNTSAGSTHTGKTRRTFANLRTDPYHNAGVQGLDAPIEPYSLTIRWPLPVDDRRNSTPELALYGNASERSKANPQLKSMVIRRCSGLSDFEHIRGRIYAHLGLALAG